MTKSDIEAFANVLHISSTTAIIIVVCVILWSLYWKWRALWMSASHGDKIWFGILFLVNTLGILDIIYIYMLAKPGDAEYEPSDKQTLG